MRDISVKQDNVGDVLNASDFNALNGELENIVTSTGQTLDPAGGPDSDLNMLGKAVTMYASGSTYYSDGGSANAYVLSRSGTLRSPTEYIDGLSVKFVAATSNTGASTINVVSIGVKDLVSSDGNALEAGDIIANDVINAVYILSEDNFRIFGVTRNLSGRINELINANFDVWQRALSQTASGYGSDDRWHNGITGCIVSHSRQTFTLGQTSVPNNPKYYSSTNVTTASTAAEYSLKEQRIADVAKSSGQTKTLSVWAKADSSKDIAVEFIQRFGTGGSPSAEVAGFSVTTLELTSSWQKFVITVTFPSVSGKTLGTNNDDYYAVRFWFNAGSDHNSRTNSLGNQSGVFDLAQIQLQEGSLVTPFELRDYADELRDCETYFEKNVDTNVFLPANTTIGLESFTVRATSAVSTQQTGVRFRTRKRAIPTVTTYRDDGSGTNPNYWAYDVTTYAAVTTNPSEIGFGAYLNGTGSGLVAGAVVQLFGHWTAEAEL